jgi:hypothetical protein
LLRELASRLGPRKVFRRTAEDTRDDGPQPQNLDHWAGRMAWADVLSVLVIDEAAHAGAVGSAIWAHAAMDRQDTGAEYGGLIEAAGRRLDAADFRAVLFPPRPGTRRGDREFTASTDMIAQGATALAHYHLHVQETRNAEFAGPSLGDLAYAARTGRNCVVFTSVREETLNADFYSPEGVVIDLGEVTRAAPAR